MKFENPALVQRLNVANQELKVAESYVHGARNQHMMKKAQEVLEDKRIQLADLEFDLHYNSREARAYRAQQSKAK